MLYELRTYNAAPGKIDALNARFRDHTCDLFARHGIGVAGFWINRADPNQLIYICTFQDAAQMESAWAAFRDDPEWQAARAESERNGPLVASIESVVMDPTDYSTMK